MTGSVMRVVLTVLIILAFINASGCYGRYSKIDGPPESVHKAIKPGNIVKVTMKDRRTRKFKVVKIDEKSISSADEQFLFSDIKKIKKRVGSRFLLLDIIEFGTALH